MKQHYRSKDFPLLMARQQYTTVQDFKLVAEANAHVLIDRLTYACLAHDFEFVQDDVRMAGPAHRQVGYLFKLGNTLIFTDAHLDPEKRWVNADPLDDNGRPQYLVVPTERLKPYDDH